MITTRIINAIRRRFRTHALARWLVLPIWGKIRYTKHGHPDRLGFVSLTPYGHRVREQQERAQENVIAYLTEFREKGIKEKG